MHCHSMSSMHRRPMHSRTDWTNIGRIWANESFGYQAHQPQVQVQVSTRWSSGVTLNCVSLTASVAQLADSRLRGVCSCQKVTGFHRKDMLPLTQGLNYRSACDSFTVTFLRKFAINRSLNIPLHLKHVATLPCEIIHVVLKS